jgi:hypothetical protein
MTKPSCHLRKLSRARPLRLAPRCVALVCLVVVAPLTAQTQPSTKQRKSEPVIVHFLSPGPAVELTIDGGRKVQVPAGGHIEVTTTAKRIDYMVARGGNWQYGGSVDLGDVSERLVKLKEPGAQILLVNRSDERQEVYDQGRLIGGLQLGVSKWFGPVKPGTRFMTAFGLRSRTWSRLQMNLMAGANHTAILPPAHTGLLMHNPTKEEVHLSVDQRSFGRLASGQTIHLLGLAPGQHVVELVGVRSGRKWQHTSSLHETGGAASVEGPITVWVENRSKETLQLAEALRRIYARPIEAGALVKLVMKRRPVRLLLRGKDSGLTYEHDVHVRKFGGFNDPWAGFT